jgi:hypothetical protein
MCRLVFGRCPVRLSVRVLAEVFAIFSLSRTILGLPLRIFGLSLRKEFVFSRYPWSCLQFLRDIKSGFERASLNNQKSPTFHELAYYLLSNNIKVNKSCWWIYAFDLKTLHGMKGMKNNINVMFFSTYFSIIIIIIHKKQSRYTPWRRLGGEEL